MPIAAVPSYLGQDFKDASLGMRFGMYLPVWTNRADQEGEIKERAERKSREAEELRDYLKHHGMDRTIVTWTGRDRNPLPRLWEKNDHASRQAWREVARLGRRDLELMRSLLGRQEALAALHEATGSLLKLDTRAVAPFTTGLGNEHPLENGFAFLNPYGLPYLPGSGVKGVLRQAARELASGQWGETFGWDEAAITALFGRESRDGETGHQRGALIFWDVIPQIEGDSLMVEIMTPHQSHYYQNGATPHESGSPNPISFLTVPPRSRFVFHVQCDTGFLGRIAPELSSGQRWEALLRVAFEHAFQWLGFGAKTAVGYGAMKAAISASGAPYGNPGQAGVPGEQPVGAQSSTTTWPAAKLTFNPGSMEIKAFFDGKATAGLKGAGAQDLLAALGERATKLKKAKELKGVAVTVEQRGNLIELKGLA